MNEFNMNSREKGFNVVENESKSIAKGSFLETSIDKGFCVLTYQNNTNSVEVLERSTDSSFLQFHFCIKGLCDFVFNQGQYKLGVSEAHSLLLYNPQRDLPIYVEIGPNSWLVSVVVSIQKFHGLFSKEADYISFLNAENKDKKYYKDGEISPSMAIVLNQLINYNLNQSIKNLYFRGKTYELLSLYFNRNEDADIEQCPFLIDEANVIKIRKAKEIIISRMAEPPSLHELSEEIGLNIKKLKEGFKQIYGDSVYSFLLDYKMEIARKLLESGEHNVNEVGLKVGYSASSHFISAFKKKFGSTPKKYVQSLN